jgi:bacterioferritin-associated ferredoxin
MDYQLFSVIIVFALALFYLGRMAYNGLKSKSGCASNCGKCAADFSVVKAPEKNKFS